MIITPYQVYMQNQIEIIELSSDFWYRSIFAEYQSKAVCRKAQYGTTTINKDVSFAESKKKSTYINNYVD